MATVNLEKLAGAALLRDFISKATADRSVWTRVDYDKSATWSHTKQFFVMRVRIDKYRVTVEMDGMHNKNLRSVRVTGKSARDIADRFLQSPNEVFNEQMAIREAA